jgi:glycosyltransferase involved in cell wall biosynthesis
MNILLVSFFDPLEPTSGSGLRSNSLLKNLAALGHTVHLFAFSQSDDLERQLAYPNIKRSCFVKRIPQSKLRAGLRSMLSLKPFGVSLYVTDKVIRTFVQFVDGEKYDSIIFDHIYTADLKNHFDTFGARIVINEHNAEHVLLKEYYANATTIRQKLTNLLDFLLLRRYEFNALITADCVIHISEECLQHFSKMIKRKSVVVPNTLPYKIKYGEKPGSGNNVLFIGSMTHGANVVGILNFIQEAWIDIHKLRPDINLMIAGNNPPPEIRTYDGKYNIQVLGYVDNLSEIYEKTSLAIAPLSIGSGGRYKILEAMMRNTLNITTTKGAEGLQVEHGKNIVIADDKRAWINSILYYLDHVNERIALEKNAHALVEMLYYYENYTQTTKDCIGK